MKLDLQFISGPLEDLCCDTIVAFVFNVHNVKENDLIEIDHRTHGAISDLFEKGFFRGGPGETLLVPIEGKQCAEKILLRGLGNNNEYSDSLLLKEVSAVIDTLEGIHAYDIATRLPLNGELPAEFIALLEKVCICFVDGFLAKHENDDCEVKIVISLDNMFFDKIEDMVSNLKEYFNGKLDYNVIFDRSDFLT